MKRENILWKKRIAALLAVSMIVGDIGSSAVVAKAAARSNVQNTQNSVEVPKEYISLNDTEENVFEEDINTASSENETKKIPVFKPSQGNERSVEETAVNSDDSLKTDTSLPKQILVIDGSEEFDNTQAGIYGETLVTPDTPTWVAPTATPTAMPEEWPTPIATPTWAVPTAVPTATPTWAVPTAVPTATPEEWITPTGTPTWTDPTPTWVVPIATPAATPTGIVPIATPAATPTWAVPTATPTAIPEEWLTPIATPTWAVPTAVPTGTPTWAAPTAEPTATPEEWITPTGTPTWTAPTPTPTWAVPTPTWAAPTPTPIWADPTPTWAVPTVTPTPTYPKLQVGDVISSNGEEFAYEWGCKTYTVEPEVSGYYSLLQKEFSNGQIAINVQGMATSKAAYWYSDGATAEYGNNFTCYMNAGESYTWTIDYYFYDTSGSCSVEFVQAEELQTEEDKFTGKVGEVAGFSYNNENIGILKIDLDSSKGYTYYMNLYGNVIKLVKDEPTYVFLQNIGEWDSSIWKNSQDEDEVEISFELTEENVMPETGGMINVKTTNYKSDNDSVREEMLVSFVPESSGYYTFHNQLKPGLNLRAEIYEEYVTENVEALTWKANTYGSTQSNIVELEAGKKYYYYIINYLYQEDYELLGEIPVCIQPVEEQEISVGMETKTLSNVAALCSFQGKEDTFYEITVTAEEGDELEVIISDNQNLANRNYYPIKNTSTFKIYCGNEEKSFLKILKKNNLDVPVSVSVKVSEYEVPEIEEETQVTNEMQLNETDSLIRKFIPTEDGTYNFWAYNYDDTEKRFVVMTPNMWGGFDSFVDAWYLDETDAQVEMEQGTVYYVQITDEYVVGEDISPENYVMGVEKVVEDTLVLDEESAEAQKQLGLYKSANITIQVPQAGFYDITVTGEAESYKLEYDGPNYVLYSGIGKEFYFAGAGEYSIRVFREIRKDSKKDEVTISVKESENVMELAEYTEEMPNKVAVNLEQSDDFQWLCFTPEETGNYLLTCHSSMNLELYTQKEDEEEGSYLSEISMYRHTTYNYKYMCYCTETLLEEGKTYYVKATTGKNGAQGNIRLLKNTQVSVEDSEEVSVETQYGTVVKYQVPENGIYQISVAGTKKVYNVYQKAERLTCKNKSTNILYLPQGEQEIVIVPQGKAEDGKKYKKEQLTIKLEQIPTEDIAKEITMETSECWVKYEPEETGTYFIGTAGTDNDLDVTVYTQGADEQLWYEDTLYSESGDTNEVSGSCKMEKGYTYYFKIRSYEVPSSFVMYVTKDVIMQGTLGESQTYDFSKHIRIDLEGITEGYYQITVNGERQEYLLSMGTNSISPYYTTVQNAECNLRYVNQEMVENEDQTIYLHINKAGIPSQENVEVLIEKVGQQAEVLQLNQKMQKENASSLDFYSFTPEKSGYYTMKLDGIESIGYDSDEVWYDGKYVGAGEKCTLYVKNCEGKSYSITPVKSHEMVVYDQKEYQAFIASGGTITLQNTSEITEEMWEELYQWDENRYTYVDADKILITSVKDFKNKNDIWFLGNTWVFDNTVYEPVENYVDIDKKLKENGNIWTYHLTGYVYQNLCDENGNIILPDSKIINEYIAWANYIPEFVPVHEIQIQGVNVLKTGETSKLTAVLATGCDYSPTDATVTWSSSNPDVVSVDGQGNIKANKQGTAVITCTANDENHKSATLNITVSEGAVYVSKVTVSGAKEVAVGDTIELKAALDTNGKGKPSRDGVTWSSNNTKVATVDQNGKVTGLSKGSVIITAASNDGKAKADYTITVKEIEAKKITLNESKITIKKGTTYKWLEASITPKNTTNQSLKWSSSNTKVATVIGNGKIKAKGIGKATITVTTSNGKKDTLQVTVTKNDIKAKKIKISKKETLYVGGTVSLSAEFTPVNTTNQKVAWSSSDEKVATVSKSGVVTAKKEGKATITVTTLDGTKKKAKCVVTVKKLSQVKGIKVSSTTKGTVELTWKKVKDADGYQILMATSSDGEYKKIGTTKAECTEFTKQKLSSGKKYYFKVVAYQKNRGKQYQGKESVIKNIKVK